MHGMAWLMQVCWNKSGDRLAACFSNNTVAVIDLNTGRAM
jgi:hypothetical protein